MRVSRHGLVLLFVLTVGLVAPACSSNTTVFVECAGAAACYQDSCTVDPSSPADCPAACDQLVPITDYTGGGTNICGDIATPTSCKFRSSCAGFSGVPISFALDFTSTGYRGTITVGPCKYIDSGSRLSQCPVADAGASDTSVPDSSKSQCDRSALCSSGCCAQHQCITPATTSACACLGATDCFKFPCDPNGCAPGVAGTPSCNTVTGQCTCTCG